MQEEKLPPTLGIGHSRTMPIFKLNGAIYLGY
jgi:hypothetical protein